MSAEAGEWEEKFHAGKQRKYWKNKSSGKTTWSEPFVKTASGAVVKLSAAATTTATTATTATATTDGNGNGNDASSEWEEKFSVQHKKKYWKNKKTGKSSWKEPPGPAATTATTTATKGTTGTAIGTAIGTASKSNGGGSGSNGASDEPAFLAASLKKTASAIKLETQTQSSSSSSWDNNDGGGGGGGGESSEWEWEEKFHEAKQRKYWKNKKTGKSTWTEPPKPDEKVASSDVSATATATATATEQASRWGPDWQVAFSEAKNRRYWKNLKTGKSQWSEPPLAAESSSAAHWEPLLNAEQFNSLKEKHTELCEEYNILKGKYVEKESILSQTRNEMEELKRARTTESSREPLVDESIVVDLEAKIEQLTNLCQTYKKSHDELEGIVKSNEELTTAYENKIQDNQKEIDDLKRQCQGYRISQEETESLFELSYQEAKAKDLADYELKLSENEERIHQLTALCDLYKRSHEEAEQRYQEASSKEQLTSADILKLQEEHDTSVRKLNAELEINIIREKTKGETTLFEVTQELNALKLENASLEAKYKLIADEKEELSQKHLVALDQISHLEINKETQGQNEQLQAELANQQERIRELELQISNNGILLDEYKRSNADLNAKFAEEKVTLTLELDTNRETVKELVDKRDELEALNHKLVIERDLLKQLNEEADERQNSRKAASDEHEPTETVEEIKLEFSNQTRRLNAEMEIKLLEERAAGEKSVLDIKREYNDLKTLHEYLNSRYNILVEEKKMFVTEINHYKQQSREIRLEKDKLEESLKDVRSEKSTETNSCPPRPPPPPPPPPSLNDKSDEIVARYEREIDELQQQYEVVSKQCETVTNQRDEYKSALNAMESDKTNWEATMEDKENSFAKLKAESEMYKSKYEESEVRFHVWENESESKGKIWTQSMKELQMLHESQVRKLTVEFEIQILEERSKGEQKLFATVSKLNSLKVTLSQKEAELNIKYDTLLAEKETLEKSYHNLQDKLSNVRDNVSKDSVVNQQDQRPERPSKARFTHNEADLLKTQLFSIIKRFDDNDTPPNSPPDSSDDDTPPNSPPPSDDESGF